MLFYRGMLCGSALTHRCIWAVRDLFESPRWGDGFDKRTCQGSCAQGETGNTGEDLWCVSLNLSYPLLCLHYHFPLNFHLHCPWLLWLPRESPIASSIWFPNNPWPDFILAGLSNASSFGSWLTDTEQMHPETVRQGRLKVCHQVRPSNKHHHAVWLATGTALPSRHQTDFKEVWLIMKCVYFLWFDFFQSGSPLRKMTKVLPEDTCLLHLHVSQ